MPESVKEELQDTVEVIGGRSHSQLEHLHLQMWTMPYNALTIPDQLI